MDVLCLKPGWKSGSTPFYIYHIKSQLVWKIKPLEKHKFNHLIYISYNYKSFLLIVKGCRDKHSSTLEMILFGNLQLRPRKKQKID